jgi:hypothetical protein
MFRLSRRLARPAALPRVLRVQRPSGTRAAVATVVGRGYASTSGPRRPPDNYSRLLATLPHVKKESEMALKIAALFSSTENTAKLDMLRDELKPHIARFNKDSLYKKVDQLLNNPPADNFNSVFAGLPEGESQCTFHGWTSTKVASAKEEVRTEVNVRVEETVQHTTQEAEGMLQCLI